MSETLRALKLWQVSILVVILLGAAGAAYGVYLLVTDSGQSGLTADQQVYTVQLGSLINEVSTNGNVLFANREALAFGTPGKVAELFVDEGDRVEEGQPLARLDNATLASLEVAVAQAGTDLRDAQEALDEVTSSSVAPAVAEARSKIDLAETDMANARLDLEITRRDWEAKQEEAQSDADTSAEAYGNVFVKWLGLSLVDGDTSNDHDALLDTYGIDLIQLFDPDTRYQDTALGYIAQGLPPDDPATPWDEGVVYAWQNLYPGLITVTCENGAPYQGACVTGEMDDAWDNQQDAMDNLVTVQSQAATAIAKSEAAVAKAEESLEAALNSLADVTDPLFLALMESKLLSAQATLDTAIERLDGATIRAPMAGIVSSVDVEIGRSVNASASIVEIVDPTVVEVDGTVDEIDVLFISRGAQAIVTLDALAGQVLAGTVTEIGSAATSQQGVVTYPLRVTLQVPAGIELRDGLSATADIVLREENNVLLVPIQALHGTFDQPVVLVLDDGRIEERSVVLGSSDDFWIIVTNGLVEGEQVVIETGAASTTQFGFGGGGFGGGFRGGFGGGGAGFGGGGGRGQDDH